MSHRHALEQAENALDFLYFQDNFGDADVRSWDVRLAGEGPDHDQRVAEGTMRALPEGEAFSPVRNKVALLERLTLAFEVVGGTPYSHDCRLCLYDVNGGLVDFAYFM